MTRVEYGELLHAYKYAVEANQDGIAELLEDVILALMDGEHEGRGCQWRLWARKLGVEEDE